MIKFQNIYKSYDTAQGYVLDDLSLDIEDGQLLVILGASGCGKTTLLKMLNRLIEPTSGTISINGHDIKTLNLIALRRAMGYVSQADGLFPHLNVFQNISMLLKLQKISMTKRYSRVEELLKLLELEPGEFIHRMPDELSGGQKQRINIARALVNNPNYLLMDEPFCALDPMSREQAQDNLLQLKTRLNKTIVFITHDIYEAVKLADRIAVCHDGKIVQDGTVKEILSRPATSHVEGLFSNLGVTHTEEMDL